MPDDATRPNVLWIVHEDLSPRLGCYGDDLARTPNLDALAAEGRRYENAYAPAGVCAPSRSAMMTGMYPTAIGTNHMRVTSDAPEVTPYEAVPPHYVRPFTEYLRAAGYFCTNDHKTDYQFEAPRTAFDECREGAHWRHRAEGQPFFSTVTLHGTHESATWDDARGDAATDTDPDAVPVPPYYPDTPVVREELARYYDAVAAMDERTGAVLDDLAADGLADETAVFVLSDHGEGFPRAKRWLYDGGVRVPLLVRWPGEIPAGAESADVVSWVDLAPTVLSLAGVDVPRHLQGRPFLGPDRRQRTYAFAARDRHGGDYDMVRAVTDGRYKYLRNYHPERPYLVPIPYRNRSPTMRELLRLRAAGDLTGPAAALFDAPRPAEELYDTAADPGEVTNLVDDPAHADVLGRLRDALDGWRERVGDAGDRPERQAVAEAWPGGEQPRTAAPAVYPNAAENREREAATGDCALTAPAEVSLRSVTQGAAIAYTTETGEDPRWRLYTGPIRLSPGETTLRARATRCGYAESEERAVTISVAAAD
jgi:arylsulfatase A-like enzyme